MASVTSSTSSSSSSSSIGVEAASNKVWIRGVNLGGWLVLERYITPYQFAVTDCHLRGDLCWYPGQVSAPSSEAPLCDLYQCKPHLSVPITGGDPDYPLDEYTLAEAFLNASNTSSGKGSDAHHHEHEYRNSKGLAIAEEWFNTHFENFIQEDDIRQLAATGSVTHVRVPLPHWILGDVRSNEPWIVGKRWEAFRRLCGWAKKYNLQVWPDIHTAPGSQNGFDNSGHALSWVSCQGWSNNPKHVERSLRVIQNITNQIVKEGLNDVVTGFGLLNEPFKDCNRYVYEQFIQQGKEIVRQTLGESTAIYVSDMFLAKTFNNGHWWLDPAQYKNTFLDSHYYHVFDENPRDLSPRQHIAYTCERHWRDATSCCYQDARSKASWNSWWWKWWKQPDQVPSQGVQRLVGEWSAAYDTLPIAELQLVMKGIATNGMAPDFDKKFTAEEIDFLKHYVEAQMVAYESVDTGTSAGWFYWTAKMEGGAFAEWDFLRGVKEGWIPALPRRDQPSQAEYGTCYDILFKTSDDREDVIHTFPDPASIPVDGWHGVPIDDDVVLSHGQTLMEPDGIHHRQRYPDEQSQSSPHFVLWVFFAMVTAGAFSMVNKQLRRRRKQAQYRQLSFEDNASPSIEV